jgi:hypothetical protein
MFIEENSLTKPFRSCEMEHFTTAEKEIESILEL